MVVSKSENIDRTVEDTPDNCLMLISTLGECGGGERRVFRCKTCMKEFSSFQALGGHRASHTKPINSSQEKSSVTKKVKTPTSHLCPICGVDFPMGQALGGHMRKHRNDKASEGALVTRSFLPEEPTLKQSTTAKRVAGLDPMDDLINLKLEL